MRTTFFEIVPAAMDSGEIREFAPIWINVQRIQSIQPAPHGLTMITMTGGQSFEIKANPHELIWDLEDAVSASPP